MHSLRKTTVYLTVLALLYILINMPTILDNNDGDGYFQMPMNRVVSIAAEAHGTTLVFSGLDGDLHFYDYLTGEVERPFSPTVENESYPSFSPDGRFVVYAASKSNKAATFLQIRSRDGSTRHDLTRADAVVETTPVFSPDGETVAFARATLVEGEQRWNLWIMDRDGSHPHQLTYSGFHSLSAPVFSDKGQFIVFAAEASPTIATHVLYRVAVNGSTPVTQLPHEVPFASDISAWATMPAVSQDGRTVAYLSDYSTPSRYHIVIANTDGTHPIALDVVDKGVLRHPPVFVEDGSLLFLGAGNTLWHVQADGTGLEKLRGADLFNPVMR